MALLDTPLLFYNFRIAVTSVATLMVLYRTDRSDICSATDASNLPQEGRRMAANFVAPLSPAPSPQAVCFRATSFTKETEISRPFHGLLQRYVIKIDRCGGNLQSPSSIH